jgi:hypothetical protein
VGTISGFAVGRRWLKAECYVFSERFRQRPVGKTFGSVRSLIPLRTMSGPQWAESELEAKAIQQFEASRVFRRRFGLSHATISRSCLAA